MHCKLDQYLDDNDGDEDDDDDDDEDDDDGEDDDDDNDVDDDWNSFSFPSPVPTLAPQRGPLEMLSFLVRSPHQKLSPRVFVSRGTKVKGHKLKALTSNHF